MSYTESQLLPGESIKFQARVHWLPYLPWYILGAVVALASIVAFINHAYPIGAGVIALGVIICASAYIARQSTEFSVTDRRIIIKVGWIHRRTLETMLGKVENIAVEQSVFGRMFGFGTIVVTGTGGTREPFTNVADPLVFRHHVEAEINAVDDARQGRIADTATSAQQNAPASAPRDERACPYCAEMILAKARICRFCQRDVTPIST